MDIDSVCPNNGSNGIYEAWLVKGGKAPVPVDENGHVIGSKLLKAVDNAFKAYIDGVESSAGQNIQGVVNYALKGNKVQVMTPQQMAPFLALSVMA